MFQKNGSRGRLTEQLQPGANSELSDATDTTLFCVANNSLKHSITTTMKKVFQESLKSFLHCCTEEINLLRPERPYHLR